MISYPLKPTDAKGRPLHAGDWVRVTALPDISALDPSAKRAFRFALNKTFRVEAFDRYGHVELDLTRKMREFHTVWIEPCFLSRSRVGRR